MSVGQVVAQLESEFPAWSVASAERTWSAFRSMPLSCVQKECGARSAVITRTSADLRAELRIEIDRDERAAVWELAWRLDWRLVWGRLADDIPGVARHQPERPHVTMTVLVADGHYVEASGDREPVAIELATRPATTADWIGRHLGLADLGVAVTL